MNSSTLEACLYRMEPKEIESSNPAAATGKTFRLREMPFESLISIN